jgi:hypothetical protein
VGSSARSTSPADLASTLSPLLGFAADPRVLDAIVGGGACGAASIMPPLGPDASGNYTRAEF